MIRSPSRIDETAEVSDRSLPLSSESKLDGADQGKLIGPQMAGSPYNYYAFPPYGPRLLFDNFGVDQGWDSQSVLSRHIGDVNGDGYADIVGVGYAGLLVSVFDREAGFYSTNLVVPSSSPSHFGITQLGDVNGDGRADLVSFKSAGMGVSYGQADATFDHSQLDANTVALNDFGTEQGWKSQNETPRLLGDVNGDGKADVIGFGIAGVWVSIATGEPGPNAFKSAALGIADFGIEQGWTSDQAYHRAVADVNGDGKADIVGFSDEGVLVSLSNGDGTFAPITFAIDNFGAQQGWTTQDQYTRLFGDVNQDGRMDILGFSDEIIYAAYGNTDGTFSNIHSEFFGEFTANKGWTSDEMFPRVVSPGGNIYGFGYIGLVGLPNLHGVSIPFY